MMGIKKKKQEPKEIPAWKLAMMEEAGTSPPSSSSKIARPREEEEEAEARKRAATAATTAAASSTAAAPDLPADDDDDDEDFDESKYKIGDESDDEEERLRMEQIRNRNFVGQRELTVEEQLLAREARDGVKRNKVFYIEDEEASLEKTAGRQRQEERRALKAQQGQKDTFKQYKRHGRLD